MTLLNLGQNGCKTDHEWKMVKIFKSLEDLQIAVFQIQNPKFVAKMDFRSKISYASTFKPEI